MSNQENIFYNPNNKDPSLMSFRQQIKYLMEQTSEGGIKQRPENTQEKQLELKEYLEDERLRVSFRQNTQPALPKLLVRKKLIDEACKIFTTIKKSIYLERKACRSDPNDILVCTCPPIAELSSGPYTGYSTVGCGWRCLNRVINTECFPGSCKAGEACTNKRFQQQRHAQTYPFKTKDRGWGLMAGQFIRKGSFIIQYLGEIYSIESKIGFQRLEKYKGSPCTYLMSTANSEVIDPTSKGNVARFINHSCDPNCETQKWNVLGEISVGIFAKRDIAEDEELTFDYRFDTHKTILMKCLCGAANCKKYLGLVPSEPELEVCDRLKCHICQATSGEDDENLLVCENCNKGYHTYCLKPPLKEAPELPWICRKCISKQKPKKNRYARVQYQDITDVIHKTKFDVLRAYLGMINEKDVNFMWKSVSQEYVEVNLRGPEEQVSEVASFISRLTMDEEAPSNSEAYEIELKIEAVYLKNVIGCKQEEMMNYKRMFDISISYDLQVFKDDFFPVNKMTSITLIGPRTNINTVASAILDKIDTLTACTVYISNVEYHYVMENIQQIRSLLLPTEIRVSKDNYTYESSHPFYFYTKFEKKVMLIGNEQ